MSFKLACESIMDSRENSLSNDQASSIGGSENDMPEEHHSIGSENQSEDREGTGTSPEVTTALIYEFMNFYTNETYLNGVKNEFLRLKIQYFSEDNLDFDRFDQSVFEDRIHLLERDVYNNIEKSFEGFDVQEINFKLDRIYKWIKIIQSKNLEFFIFYNKEKIEEKDKLLNDPRFCNRVDLSEFKKTLSVASQLSLRQNQINENVDEKMVSEVEEKRNTEENIGMNNIDQEMKNPNETNHQNEKLKIDADFDDGELDSQQEISNRIDKYLESTKQAAPEISEDQTVLQRVDQLPEALKIHSNNQDLTEANEEGGGGEDEPSSEQLEKRIIASLALHLRNQVEQLAEIKKAQEEVKSMLVSETGTPIKSDLPNDIPTHNDNSPDENADEHLPTRSENLIRKIQHSSESLTKLKGLAVESKTEFEEFFNVNMDKERVSEEYESAFRGIVASPEFLSFAINEEYILVLRPQKSIPQKTAKIFSSTRILKTKILEYLNIFDILKLRLTCKQFKEIVKSVWHVIHKKEMYNQAIYVTVNRYVA